MVLQTLWGKIVTGDPAGKKKAILQPKYLVAIVLFLSLSGVFLAFNLEFIKNSIPALTKDRIKRIPIRFRERLLRNYEKRRTWRAISNSDLRFLQVFLPAKSLRELASNVDQLRPLHYWGEKKYVRGILYQGGRKWKIRMRLRGLTSIHLGDRKKSWRIRGRGKNMPLGFRSFNLIILYDRGYASDYTFNYMARKLGLLTLRDDFGILSINGQFVGVYYLIEQFSKEFLAQRNLPESGIYGLDNVTSIPENKTHFTIEEVNQWGMKLQAKNHIRYPEGKDPYMPAFYRLAYAMRTKDFRAASELINIEKYLKYHALLKIFASRHGTFPTSNSKLYWNSIFGKFEPIPWDTHLYFGRKHFKKHPSLPQEGLLALLFEDSAIYERYQKLLWHIVANYGRRLLKVYDDATKRFENELMADRLKKVGNNTAKNKIRTYNVALRSNISMLREGLDRTNVSVRLKICCENSGVSLNFQPISTSPIRVEAISAEWGRPSSSPMKAELTWNFPGRNRFVSIVENLIIPQFNGKEIGRNLGENIPGISHKPCEACGTTNELELTVRFSRNNTSPLPIFHFKIKNIITGRSAIVSAKPSSKFEKVRPRKIPWNADLFPPDQKTRDRIFQSFRRDVPKDIGHWGLLLPSMNEEEFVRQYPAFDVEKAGLIRLREGKHFFTKNVIIPRGGTLLISAGAELYLSPGVSLVSFRSVRAMGTQKKPIVIRSSKPDSPFGIFGVVIRPGTKEDTSTFQYVSVSNGSEAFINGIRFTGALSVFGGRVKVVRSAFTGNRGDDALNIKKSDVKVKHNLFENNTADGIDLDWVTGTISRNVFTQNRGDGIDLSGSVATISGNRIEKMGDKGISVGERSSPLIINNLISDSKIGLASKDSSNVNLVSNTLIRNNIGVALYQKKRVFGGGSVSASNNLLRWNQTTFYQDDSSRLTLRGKNAYKNSALASRSNSIRTTNDVMDLGKDAGKGDIFLLPPFFRKNRTEIGLGILDSPPSRDKIWSLHADR